MTFSNQIKMQFIEELINGRFWYQNEKSEGSVGEMNVQLPMELELRIRIQINNIIISFIIVNNIDMIHSKLWHILPVQNEYISHGLPSVFIL
jgi:hypothetical protein